MLRPDTERLWHFLERQLALNGFILVGGTALAMHLGHRLSEDLDFMVPASKLPRASVDALKRASAAAGFTFVANDSAEALAEFEDSGMSYHDYQQDYVVGGSVKVTFVAPDPEVEVLLGPGGQAGPRVASLEEIFRLKCIACANRSKSRDWLDMYVMLSLGLFPPDEVFRTFELAGVPSKYDIAMSRMCSANVGLFDEGYESLLAEPPSLQDMRDYFIVLRDQIEALAAERRARDVLAGAASMAVRPRLTLLRDKPRPSGRGRIAPRQ